MKKLVLLFLIMFMLTSCSSKTIDKDEVSDKYIKPINQIDYYDYLNDSLKNKLKNVYEDQKVTNNLLELVDTKLPDINCLDYYDNPVYFRDLSNGKVVFEIVQYSCDHCLKQVPLTEEILKNSDITFVQYFAYGSKEQIDDFYDKADRDIPKDLLVIPENKELSNYFMDEGVDSTPTFLFYEDGNVRLAKIAELSYAQFINATKLAYESPFTSKDLVDNNGDDVRKLLRTYDDVLDDLSTESKDKLAKITNAEELTINVIGKYLEFYSLYEEEAGAIYKLDTYTKYINKPLVVFYLGYINNNLEDDINLINAFKNNHKDLNVLTILMDTKDIQTSSVYQGIDLELNTDYVSSNSVIPKQLLDTKVNEYLAALFIQDNIFTGGVSGIKSVETIENAYNTFIGEESIALIKNNIKD